MGNCATKPKVVKDSDEDLIPVERETTAPADHNKDPVEKIENNAHNAEEEAAARRSEKGKEILIEDDVEEHSKRQSLSNLFHENKTVELGAEVTQVFPSKLDTNNKLGASSEVSKLDDTSAPRASSVIAPEIFDVQTRNDLEVKIPKDSKVKTPETPKAKEAEEQEVNFSENWEVKFPEELEAKTLKKSSDEESKLADVFEVSTPELFEVKVIKESEVPEDLEDKVIPEVSKVQTDEVSEVPELSEVKVTKESDVPEVLEDKNIQEDSEVRTDEVKVAESELLKVSEVESSEDLEIEVPKVFEVKTPELEVKTDQEASKVKMAEEKEVPEFVDAKEKIDKPDQDQIHEGIKVIKDKEIVLPKTEEEEDQKDVSLEKQVKESTLSDLGNK